MVSIDTLTQNVDELTRTFAGQLLDPSTPTYEEARKVYNGLIDKRPILIAQCRGVADVVDALRLAREHGLEVAVRGGGHNVSGRATIDGGVMIDLTPMKGVHVDAKARIARAEGGVTWAELNRETQMHGLATTGGIVSTTGVAGLTLGGGLGWLMGKYGLALDNLLSIDIVTADGRLLKASTDENPELFWAVRGGGGNFGVVTSFEFQLHPVGPAVTGGLIAYPLDDAREVLRFYRELTASAPDELTVFAALAHAPDGSGRKLAAIVPCHCGSLETGEAAVREIKAFRSPLMDMVGPIPYCEQNMILDAGFPKGAMNYWKSSYLTELSDEAIDRMVDCFAACPAPMGQLVIEHFHGAATQIGANETAFPHRTEGYNFLALSEWTDPAANDRCIAWARDSYGAMESFTATGRYVNYLGDDEIGDPVAAAYGANYQRLREVKTAYDPENVFHMNQNIPPLA